MRRLEARERAAADLGCSAEFDAYVACREEQSACDKGFFGDLDLRCSGESEALAAARISPSST